MNEQEHVDPATLDMLHEVLEDGFAGLLETFLQDSGSKIDSLKSALQAGDADAVRRNAHSLKGSSSNLGAGRLAQLSLEVERRAREETLEGVDELLGCIEAEYEAVTEIMHARLATL